MKEMVPQILWTESEQSCVSWSNEWKI